MHLHPKTFTWIAAVSFFALAAPTSRADDAAEQLAAASALFDARKFAEAAQKLQTFVTDHPKHARVGAAAFALGRSRAELKQWAQAIPAYDKAIASNDKGVLLNSRLGLGEAAMNAGQYERAIPALQSAVAGSLVPAQAAAAWFWLGQAHFHLSRFLAAEEAYQKVLSEHGKAEFADIALLGSGLSALRLGRTEDARTRLRQLLQRFPQSGESARARLALAQIETEAKRYADARGYFEAVLSDEMAKKAGAEIMVTAEDGLIHVLLEAGDHAAAATRIEESLKRIPPGDAQRFRAQLALGHCRYRQKQNGAALAAYQDAAKGADAKVAGEAIYWAGNVLLSQDRKPEAGAQFRELHARFPAHPLAPKAALKAGDIYSASGKTEPATAAYRLVLEKYPRSEQAVEARKALNRLAGVISDPAQLAAAIKSLPADQKPAAQLRLARIHFDAKRFSEAPPLLTDIQSSGAPTPLKAEARYLAGLIFEAKDTGAAASAGAFQEAVTLNPKAEWASHAQSRLAWLYLELKQPAKAEAAAGAALKLTPPADVTLEARLALTQARLDQKKWDAAIEATKLLLEGAPSPETLATVLFTQAWANDQRGKPDEALPYWERLASEFPRSEFTPEALMRVGDARTKASKFEEAADRYTALVKGFTAHPRRAEARFKLASALFNLDRTAEAAAEFDAVSKDKAAGDYLPEALYWAGVAHDKAGKKVEAIQRLSRLVAEFRTHTRVANARIRLAALKAAGN